MSKKVAVALCISNFRQGGAETQFWNLVKGLDREQFVVHVIQIENKKRKPVVHQYPCTSIHIVKARFHMDPLTIRSICACIKQNKIELLQSILFMDNQFARVAGIISGIPVISSVRGELRPIVGAKKTFIEIQMQRFSSRVVVNSKWLMQELVKEGAKPDKIEVIYNGIEIDALQCDNQRHKIREGLGIPVSASVIGIVARLHPMKDHKTYLKVIKRLVRGDLDVYGLIVGGGAEETRIKELVEEEGLGNRVIFSGEIRNNIGCWIRSLDVLMLTSKWGESFPNTILEAMACGVPVVATDVSAVREIIVDGENGYLGGIGDSSTLAFKVSSLLSDRVLAARIIMEGRKTVGQLGMQRMVKKFSDLYMKVLGNRGH